MMAQFSAHSSLSYDYGQDNAISGVENIVVFQTIDSTASIQYTHADSAIFEWVYHTISDSVVVRSGINDTITVLDSLKAGGYELFIDSVSAYFYYVVDFAEHQPALDSVWVDDSGDSCHTLRLYATLERDEIPVFDLQKDSTYLLKHPTTLYQWTDTVMSSSDELEAPYEDIAYECSPYSDNFFSENDLTVLYTKPDTLMTDLYYAKAVKLGVIDASIPEEDPDVRSNALKSSSADEGSAPLSVTYSVDPQGGDYAVSWWIWATADDQPNSPLYSQDKITHTFRAYEESGYTVRAEVENDFCVDSGMATVMVYESDLQAPNILVLGFSANEGGQFKVAYQSIDPSTFKAFVYDRWGRLMHKWEDPTAGWDGRSPMGGAFVSPGPYYYIIRAEGTDGREFELKGDLSVIREKGIK